MVNLNVTSMHIKNPSTGEWDEIAIIAGKSAYQSAVDGGYQGTEAEFNTDLANCGTANALPLAGGTMDGDINMDGNAVTGLPTPIANADAVPKSYADTKYTKPSDGIPQTDLASAVRNKLDKIVEVSHSNLFDNWYFLGGGSQNGAGIFPINQRGQQSYSGSGYGLDRWKINGNAPANITTTINSNGSGLTITDTRTSGTSSNWITQFFDAPLPNGTYTLSVLISSMVLGGKLGVLDSTNSYISDYSRPDITIGLNAVTFTVSDSSAIQAGIVLKPLSSITVSAIKLERGSYQTLAHNEGTEENPNWVLNEIPNYSEELLKCQKYFQIIPPCGEYMTPIGHGIGYGTTQIRVTVPLSTAMVKTPTVTIQNCNVKFYLDDIANGISQYTAVEATPNTSNGHYRPYVTLRFTVTGALNAKIAEFTITSTGGTNPGILLSAE